LPNPRDLACALHSEAHEIEPFITHMLSQWGQFLTHDITSLSITRGKSISQSLLGQPVIILKKIALQKVKPTLALAIHALALKNVCQYLYQTILAIVYPK
jgi:hypothetical protein